MTAASEHRHRQLRRRRSQCGRYVAFVGLLLISASAAAGCSGGDPAEAAEAGRTAALATPQAAVARHAVARPATVARPDAVQPTAGSQHAVAAPPAISLGRGALISVADSASAWVAANPDDPRTPLITKNIAGRPSALWLTGAESFGNLAAAVKLATARDGTLTLTIWNIPLRYDGLSAPTVETLQQYEAWLNKVADALGSTRAIVVLEPDALWFYDRMPTRSDQVIRINALRYAVGALHTHATRTRVYIDAGTSSGSVTAKRMATLLAAADLKQAAGFAVNVSSFSPAAEINRYAQAIRAALQKLGYADPRYVVDTGRNGAASWDFTWCNPSGQRLGTPPALIDNKTGLDLDLWVKGPGTSDGDCGVSPDEGKGSVGGQFLPAVAYEMIKH